MIRPDNIFTANIFICQHFYINNGTAWDRLKQGENELFLNCKSFIPRFESGRRLQNMKGLTANSCKPFLRLAAIISKHHFEQEVNR
jgi:hypothetical protein